MDGQADGFKSETRISSEEARTSWSEMLDRAWTGARLIITRNTRERAVLIGWDDYQRLVELASKARRPKAARV